eukprot:6892-Chlamydomonas_euryale.AAC.1
MPCLSVPTLASCVCTNAGGRRSCVYTTAACSCALYSKSAATTLRRYTVALASPTTSTSPTCRNSARQTGRSEGAGQWRLTPTGLDALLWCLTRLQQAYPCLCATGAPQQRVHGRRGARRCAHQRAQKQAHQQAHQQALPMPGPKDLLGVRPTATTDTKSITVERVHTIRPPRHQQRLLSQSPALCCKTRTPSGPAAYWQPPA